METHSLFSLEIVVEKLYLPNISCRFPTIACKLLDFPVITIDLVEKSTADAMRKKFKSKPDWSIPDQFENLKDLEDTFRFEHGKSCLFKICPQTLKSLLLNVPLYVMVLDTMPNPPKLAGNASVPLDTAIKKICSDLSRNGPDVPVIYKDTGLLRIYNLMAQEIGYMTFGYRLLYLGPTLLPHLCAVESKTDAAELEKLAQNDSVGDIENTPTTPRPMPRLRSALPKEVKKNPEINVHTETLESQEEETIPKTIISDENANVSISEPLLTKEDKPKDFKVPVDNNQSNNIITNQNCQLLNDMEAQPGNKDPFPPLYCPPPIFYRKSNSKILSSDPDVLNNKEYDSAEFQQPDEQLPFEDSIQQPKNNYNSPSVVEMETPEKISKTLKNKPKTKTVDTLLATDLNKYPYLSGILKELSAINIPGVIQQIIDNLKEQNSEKFLAPDKGQQRGKSCRSRSAPTKRTQVRANVREKQIPQNQSWIRCTQQLSRRKSSLEFGLTKTHILRMNKLRSLDEEDSERGKFREDSERGMSRKAEKGSTFKVKMSESCSKSSKKNRTILQEEVRQEKPSKIVQEERNEVNPVKERNEVNTMEERNEVNVLEERNKVNVVREINEVNSVKEWNEVNAVKQWNEVNAVKQWNEVNAVKQWNEVNVVKEKNKVNVRERNEAEDKEVKLSGNEPTKPAAITEELPIKDIQKIQKEVEEMEKMVILKKEENKSEEENEPELIQKQSSVLTDISNKDESLLENKNQSDHSVKVRVYSDEESARSLKSGTEDDNDEFNNSDDNKSDKVSKENQRRKSIDLEERQRKESNLLTKPDSRMEAKAIKDGNRPIQNQQIKENQKVPSFEKPEVSMHQNLSSFIPLSATSPQLRPRFSRGSSLQESNASSSTILSETPVPTPRTRRLPMLMKKDSIHTDSVSSYRPSEDNDEFVSYSSSKHSKSPPEDYSDDFLTSESEEEESTIENQQRPKILSENKLGYTIW